MIVPTLDRSDQRPPFFEVYYVILDKISLMAALLLKDLTNYYSFLGQFVSFDEGIIYVCVCGETIFIDPNNIVLNTKYLILRLWGILWNYEYLLNIDVWTIEIYYWIFLWSECDIAQMRENAMRSCKWKVMISNPS